MPPRRRPLEPLAAVAAAAAVIVVLVAGLDFAMRPSLGPDIDEAELTRDELVVHPRFGLTHCWSCFHDDDDEHFYDVNAALRSDEPNGSEPEPEGEGPARRRYVRPESVVAGRVTLVTDETGVTERRRRRRAL